MPRFRLLVAYDGTRYSGWQRQPNAATVQGALEAAVARMSGGRVTTVVGASRTDAGVHAQGQVVAFDDEGANSAAAWHRGLNALTPGDLVIREVVEVDPAFSPRFDARGKWYRYLLWLGYQAPPALQHQVWPVGPRLSLEAMRQATPHLQGERDFAAFRASDCSARTTTRFVERVDLTLLTNPYLTPGDGLDPALVAVDVRGNAFLKNMVRVMVGTLVDVGRGRRTPDDVAAILASLDRRRAGRTAPAAGLTLVRVFYGPDAVPAPSAP